MIINMIKIFIHNHNPTTRIPNSSSVLLLLLLLCHEKAVQLLRSKPGIEQVMIRIFITIN